MISFSEISSVGILWWIGFAAIGIAVGYFTKWYLGVLAFIATPILILLILALVYWRAMKE